MIIVPELIKTLEGLLNQGDSPIGSEFGVIIDKQTIKTAIDLINSQQKEVERLISILLKLLDGITTWGIINNVDTTDFSLIPIIEEQKNNIVKKIRRDVIDELSEKLKSRTTTAISCDVFESVVRESTIDEVIRKMRGD